MPQMLLMLPCTDVRDEGIGKMEGRKEGPDLEAWSREAWLWTQGAVHTGEVTHDL